MAYVLFSAMRNESPFILEWVSYHKSIGFDKIFIVSNDSTDRTDDLLCRLSDCGEIDHIRQSVPEGSSPQENAVRLARDHKCLDEGDWGIFLDADEFLNIKLGNGTVSCLSKYLEAQDKIGIMINWRVFGDSGHSHFKGRYISEDYICCDSGVDNIQFKTFFKKTLKTAGFSAFLHLCDLTPEKGRLSDFLTPLGASLNSEYQAMSRRKRIWLDDWIKKGKSPLGAFRGTSEPYEIGQINHYMVRDSHSFRLKRIRGRGYGGRGNLRHTNSFYKTWNRNEAIDVSILKFKKQTDQEMDRLIRGCELDGIMKMISRDYRESETLLKVEADHGEQDKPLKTCHPDVDAKMREIWKAFPKRWIRKKLQTHISPTRVNIYDCEFIINPSDNYTELFMWQNHAFPEEGAIRYLSDMLSFKCTTIVDVGANAGTFSLPILKQCEGTSRLVAFDPNPLMVERMKTNAFLNNLQNISIFNCAVGAENAETTLNFPENNNLGEARVGVAYSDGLVQQPLTVAMRLLTDCLNEAGVSHIDLLKVDVEGSEDTVIVPLLSDPQSPKPTLIYFEDAHNSLWKLPLIETLKNAGYVEANRFKGNVLYKYNSFVSEPASK